MCIPEPTRSGRMDSSGDDDSELCRWASTVRAAIACLNPGEAAGVAGVTVPTYLSGAGQQQE